MKAPGRHPWGFLLPSQHIRSFHGPHQGLFFFIFSQIRHPNIRTNIKEEGREKHTYMDCSSNNKQYIKQICETVFCDEANADRILQSAYATAPMGLCSDLPQNQRPSLWNLR